MRLGSGPPPRLSGAISFSIIRGRKNLDCCGIISNILKIGIAHSSGTLQPVILEHVFRSANKSIGGHLCLIGCLSFRGQRPKLALRTTDSAMGSPEGD